MNSVNQPSSLIDTSVVPVPLPAVCVGDHWVIELADDYSWTAVGDPGYKYLWILSRTATLDASVYAQAMERARANGFDTTRLVRTQQN